MSVKPTVWALLGLRKDHAPEPCLLRHPMGLACLLTSCRSEGMIGDEGDIICNQDIVMPFQPYQNDEGEAFSHTSHLHFLLCVPNLLHTAVSRSCSVMAWAAPPAAPCSWPRAVWCVGKPRRHKGRARTFRMIGRRNDQRPKENQ